MMENAVGNLSGGLGGDQVIKVPDFHTKELRPYSVGNRKVLKVSAVIQFAF